MRNFVLKIILVLLVSVLISCASLEKSDGIYRPMSEFPNDGILDSIGIRFGSVLCSNEEAYTRLLDEAKKKYTEDFDIVNITWRQYDVYVGQPGGFFVAYGTVVRLSPMRNVVNALEKATENVSEKFATRTRIAIVYITAQDRSTSEYITGELEHILQRQGFRIIDRSELDIIRAEQKLGLSEEVDDNTAARIGNISGADIVITGRVDGEGDLRRLRLRALDTTSGQVVGTASERL